jgi:hypothetical protein
VEKNKTDRIKALSISNYLGAIKRTLLEKIDSETYDIIEERIEMIHVLIEEIVETEEERDAREILEEQENNYYRDLGI